MSMSASLLKHLPSYSNQLNRKLQLIHFIYAKYKRLKDEITNKQIQYMLANDGILKGELQPNTQAYLRQYDTIFKQTHTAQALIIENQGTISQCLDLVDQLLEKIGDDSDVEDITEQIQAESKIQHKESLQEKQETSQESKSSYSQAKTQIKLQRKSKTKAKIKMVKNLKKI